MRVSATGWLPAFRRCARAAALALATLILASCAGHSSPGPTATTGPAAVPGPDAGRLRITQVRVGNAVPIEGTLSYIRIERASGVTLVERQLPAGQGLTVKLNPGVYQLASWQRTCDANCGHLDPPSNRCAQPFTVKQHEHLKATIRVDFGSPGCVIVLER